MISNNELERALSHAAKEHERKRTLETEGHEKDLHQPDKKAEKRADTARLDRTRRDTQSVHSVV